MSQVVSNASFDARPQSGAVSQRLWEIDTLRGVAVVLMVFYHFMWDLSFIGWYGTRMSSGPWQGVARGIGTTFIVLLGLSATLTYNRQRRQVDRGAVTGPTGFAWYLRRGAVIFSGGLLITLVTYFFTPKDFVIFGILHLLGLSLILVYPFLRLSPWISLIVGLVAIGVWTVVDRIIVSHPWLLWLGFKQAGRHMSDYYPLLPWFGVVLLGVFVGFLLYPDGSRRFALPDPSAVTPIRALRFLGRHSLMIYLLHQPILMGVLLGIQALT